MKIEINEKNKYSTKDIAKWIRQTLKEEIKDCKFSVTMESYAGGSSINVSLLESKNIRLLKKFDEITESEILSIMSARNDTKEEVLQWIKNLQESKYHQINQYHLDTDWSLTGEGLKLMKQVLKIVNEHNYDNSDVQSDYFDVNYYLNLSLGRYERPFIDGEVC